MFTSSGAPAGYYKGTVAVQRGCSGTYPSSTSYAALATLPIIIAVWQWPHSGYMPSTSTLGGYHIMGDNSACEAFYGTNSGGAACGSWPGSGGSPTTATYIAKRDFAALYLDHRMQGSNQAFPAGPFPGSFATYYGPLMNGTGNTILPGAEINSMAFSDDGGTRSAMDDLAVAGMVG